MRSVSVGLGSQLTLQVHELTQDKFGGFAWECAHLLASLFVHLPHLVASKHLLEVSGGVGLPGIVLAL